MASCPVCLEFPMKFTKTGDDYLIECVRCGKYGVTGTAVAVLKGAKLSQRQRANISGWLFENPGYMISTEHLLSLRNIRIPDFHSRADKLLQTFAKCTEYAGQSIEENQPVWMASSYSMNVDELYEILEYLASSRRISWPPDKSVFKITPNGWEHLEKIKEANPGSSQCFVAMWFDDSMRKIYDEVLAKAIREAGYEPLRVDQREHNDKIDDEIIAQIRRSRFIVADFTGQRGGVYYEAGFAKGLGLGVVFTCRKDEIEKLHFDIRQYNCIDWEVEDLTNFGKRLKSRIESVYGHGPG